MNRVTAKMFEIVIALCKPKNMSNTRTLHALVRTLFWRHIACAGVWSNARVRYNPMTVKKYVHSTVNSLLFVLIELKKMIPFCCAVLMTCGLPYAVRQNWIIFIRESKQVSECYNHACTSDATAVFVEIFLEQISRWNKYATSEMISSHCTKY